ncbi:MAG: 2-hydroxyacyl-CoA dehydratase, partial [Desulfotignum sp.]
VLKWYEVQARYYDVPLFIFDTPVCHTDFFPETAAYVKAQITEYIGFLESVTKRKLDMDRMNQVGHLSLEGQKLWQQVLKTTARTAVDFYKELLTEMEDRISKNISIVPDEQYRLLWDNLPVWHRLKWLSQKFSDHKACLVADTYTSAWCGAIQYIDPDNFLDSIAQAYT